MDGSHIGTKGEYDVGFFLSLCFFFLFLIPMSSGLFKRRVKYDDVSHIFCALMCINVINVY